MAILAFVLFAVAALIVVGSAGFIGITLVVLGLVGGSALLAGGYWFLARRGPARWAGLALAIIAVALFVATFARDKVLLVALVAVVLVMLGGTAARSALRHSPEPWMPTYEAPAPLHPFFVMDPRAGGGKVGRFHLGENAEALGAEVTLLDGPSRVDVASLVQNAVARGADLLGVAGGDGTQALVAGIAADHDLPFVVIRAGTRNHVALDLGLDRQDPAAGLDALADGVEVRVDLGVIGDRPFVNNASFGAYAQIVQSPDYRDNKGGTALSMLPDLLNRQGETLTALRHPPACAPRATPGHRPGVPPPPVRISWRKLWLLAAFRPVDVAENS